MDKQGIADRVMHYESIKRSTDTPHYPLEKEGYWRVTGGLRNVDFDSGLPEGGYLGIFQGKYVDVVAWAVQQEGFYGDKMPGLDHTTGIIREVVPKKLKDGGVLDIINNRNLLK
jgi:hypothetical protein